MTVLYCTSKQSSPAVCCLLLSCRSSWLSCHCIAALVPAANHAVNNHGEQVGVLCHCQPQLMAHGKPCCPKSICHISPSCWSAGCILARWRCVGANSVLDWSLALERCCAAAPLTRAHVPAEHIEHSRMPEFECFVLSGVGVHSLAGACVRPFSLQCNSPNHHI